jgi:hypothetical protein
VKVGDLVRINPDRRREYAPLRRLGLVVSNDLVRLSFVPDRVIVLWQNGTKETAVPDHLEILSESR